MRRVHIDIFCSPCFHEEQKEVRGEGLILAIGWAEPKVLDLCPEHRKASGIDTLTEWLHKYGEEPEDDHDPREDRRCPVDPYCNHGEPFKSIGGRNQHLRKAHQMGPEEAFAQ